MNNLCPVCQRNAMSAGEKLVKRPFVCQQCGQELRLNLVYTLLLSAVYLFVVVRVLMQDGFSASAIGIVAVATAVFTGLCVLLPLEAKRNAAG